MSRSVRLLLHGLIGMLVFNVVPLPMAAAPRQAPTVVAQQNQDLPVPIVPTYQEPQYPAQPGLALTLAADPPSISLGMTTTLMLAITNRSATDAQDLLLRLPIPDGVELEPDSLVAAFSLTKLPDSVVTMTEAERLPAPVIENPKVTPPANDLPATDSLTPRFRDDQPLPFPNLPPDDVRNAPGDAPPGIDPISWLLRTFREKVGYSMSAVAS